MNDIHNENIGTVVSDDVEQREIQQEVAETALAEKEELLPSVETVSTELVVEQAETNIVV